MEIVPAISGGSVGAIGVVGENAIHGGVDRAATAGGQTTDIIADKLLTICVTVENGVEKEGLAAFVVLNKQFLTVLNEPF